MTSEKVGLVVSCKFFSATYCVVIIVHSCETISLKLELLFDGIRSDLLNPFELATCNILLWVAYAKSQT